MGEANLSVSDYRKLAKPKRAKYGAVPTVVDGIRFHSKAEAGRWCELKRLEQNGWIKSLERQKSFPLTIGGQKLGEIRLDFWYLESMGLVWERIAEDFKGYDNALSRWKRKHFEAQYEIPIRVTGASRRRAAA